MTTFDFREQAFEAKFAYDEDLAFRVTARRDKLMAHWLGMWLGLGEAAQAALTSAILSIPNTAPHDALLLEFAQSTASSHGRWLPRSEFAEHLVAFDVQAKAELMEGHPIKS